MNIFPLCVKELETRTKPETVGEEEPVVSTAVTIIKGCLLALQDA